MEEGFQGDAQMTAGVEAVEGSRLVDEERSERKAAAGRQATGGAVGHILRLVAQGGESVVAGLLVAFAAAFNLYHLYPEVAIKVPPLNDWNLHLVGLRGAVAALAAGHDPTDPWIGTIALGFPLFHHYQHLAYLPPALLYHLLSLAGGQGPDLVDVMSWTSYLLLSLFPLSVFWSLRRFGFSSVPAALAGLAAPLVATNGLYGLDFSSYVWRGSGLFTQLWGMVLLPLALGQGYATMRNGRGYFWAVLLVAATMLSHLVLGYVAAGSLALFALLAGSSRGFWIRGLRLVLLLALVGLVTAYFLVPFVLDRPYMNRSVWELRGKYDAYGYEWTLGALIKGELFDFGRFPSLTLLAGLGLAHCAWRWREERYRVPVLLSGLWLLLYFGRPTWGVLLNLLPMAGDLHLHRLIAGVHLGGIYLVGLGLVLPWRLAMSWRHRPRAAWLLPVLIVPPTLVLYPAYRERAAYLVQNARWMVESRQALAAEEPAFGALLAALRGAPPGRVHAGLAAGWGGQYRVGAVPMYALLNGAGVDTVGYLYHALSLNSDVQLLFDERRPEHYDLFNVRYVVAPAGRAVPDFVRPLQDFGRHRLYQVVTSGYFDVVESELTLTGGKGDLYPAAARWLASELPAAKQHPAVQLGGATGDQSPRVPLSQAASVISQSPPSRAPARGRVLSEAVGTNAYAAWVDVERDSTVVLKATYHPNWRAYIDGVEAKAFMVLPSFIGVKVAPSSHNVRLQYSSGPLRSSLLGFGLLALGLIAVAERRRDALAGALGRLKARTIRRLPQQLRGYAVPDIRWVMRWRVAPHNGRTVAAALAAASARLTPHLPFLGGLAAITLLAGLPLFQFKVMKGHDALEYLPRNVEFYRGLQAGEIFPRWAPDLNAGYGEPLFNFNPPLIYYASALFHALGFSFVAAGNLASFGLLMLAAVGMYLLAGDVFGRRGGLVAAVAYIFAPYVLVTLYVRHALADFAAFAFIPLAIWGLYRFAMGGRGGFLVLGAAGVGLLLLSSNTVALFTVPAFGLLAGYVAVAERSRRALLRGSWCLALGLGLSAFFWLPALQERGFVHVSRLLEGYLNYRNHFVHLTQLIHSPWGYGLSLPGAADQMSFATGPVHLALVGAAVLFLRRVRLGRPRAGVLISFFLVLLGLAAFFASTQSLFVWERLPLLQYLEFPWRFLSLIAVSTAFLCGLPFLLLERARPRLANALMWAMLAGLFFAGFPRAKPEGFHEVRDVDYGPGAIVAKNLAVTTAREYEPIWVRERPQTPPAEPLTLLSGAGRVEVVRLQPGYREFRVAIGEPARLRLHTFYFPGWTLHVDGAPRPIDYGNPQGVMEFPLERGEHRVELRFTDTPIRRWAAGLSLLALCVLAATPWLVRRGKRVSEATPETGEIGRNTPARRDAATTTVSNALLPHVRVRAPGAASMTPRAPATVPVRTLSGIYLLFLSIYLLSSAGHFTSTDHIAVYLTTKSLVERQTVAIEPIPWTAPGPNGRYYGVFGVGQSLLSSPLYVLGAAVDAVSPAPLKRYWAGPYIGNESGTVWGGTVPIFFVSLFNQFVTPLICVVVFLFATALGYGSRVSLAVTLMFGLGTSAWANSRDYFQHPLETLLLLLTIYIVFAHRHDLKPKHALLSGAALGLGILTRINLLLIAPMMFVYLLHVAPARRVGAGMASAPARAPARLELDGVQQSRLIRWLRRVRDRRAYAFAFLVPLVLVLAFTVLLNYLKFGDPLNFGNPYLRQGLFRSVAVGLYGYLFSVGRSVLLYSPPALLGVLAARRFFRSHRAEGLLFCAIFAVYLLLYASLGEPGAWHGGWSWGPRYLLATVPLLMLPAGYLLTSRRSGVAAALLCLLGIGIQILGVSINYSYIHWDWLRMNLNPVTAYLFVPEISPIPTHLAALLANRHVDLWLMEVYKQFGGGVLALTLVLPAGIGAGAVALLGNWEWRRRAEWLRDAPGGTRSAAHVPTRAAGQ